MDEKLEIKRFIDRIVLYFDIFDRDIETASKLFNEIVNSYSVLKVTQENFQEDLFLYLDANMTQNVELYIFTLSILYCILCEKIYLDKAKYLLMHNDMEYFNAEAISYNLLMEYSQGHASEITYFERRELRRNMLKKLRHLIYDDVKVVYQPYEERNHKNIVLMTDQLLGINHAPTKMVLQTYFQLKEMGYEVMLIVAAGCTVEDDYRRSWHHCYRKNIVPELDGNFIVCYNGYGKPVEGYQLRYNKSHFSAIKRIIKKIQHWKPECVWFIGGGEYVFQDFFADMTTLVAMPCVRGYSPSEAQILVSIAMDNSEEVLEMKEYIKNQRQKMINISFAVEDKDNRRGAEISVDFPQDKFLIALVGNRLESEIDGRFKKIMREIIDRNSQCHYLLIGEYKKEFEEGLKEHITKCGYQEDLPAYLKRADIFLNPIRCGGGWSAVMALSVGTPVITLPDCDVAANCGQEFICKTEDEIPEMVSRYINDENFRENQAKASFKRYQDNFNVNMKIEFGKVLKAVRELSEEN